MVNVVDGDTIGVVIGGQQHRVRYLSVDAPELGGEPEPFAVEAAARNRELVLGKTVLLERDVTEADEEGRLLRYVWTENGVMVNAILVSAGLAEVTIVPPDVRYVGPLFDFGFRAEQTGYGIWSTMAEVGE